MRQVLVWLMVFGVIAGLSTRLAAGPEHFVTFTHSHEHDGDHHHHPHDLPLHDDCGGEDCPDSPHKHHHGVCCSPLVSLAERMENGFRAGLSGGHRALLGTDEAPPDGPYPELDTPPLI